MSETGVVLLKLSVRGVAQVAAATPYLPEFVSQVKNLGGKFYKDLEVKGHPKRSYWMVDTIQEERLRELCVRLYGTDGSEAAEQGIERVTLRCTVRADIPGWQGSTGFCSAYGESLYLCNRVIARAWGRDSGAKLGEGIVLLSGKVTSGGSAKNWRTQMTGGSVFEITKVPRTLAEAEIAALEANRASINGAHTWCAKMEIVEDLPAQGRKAALQTPANTTATAEGIVPHTQNEYIIPMVPALGADCAAILANVMVAFMASCGEPNLLDLKNALEAARAARKG